MGEEIGKTMTSVTGVTGRSINASEIGQDGGIANFMQDLRDTARASNGYVLEIGVGKGLGSTLAFYEGLCGHDNPLHVSVDMQDYMEWKPDVPWWYFLVQNSTVRTTVHEVMERFLDRMPGVIFIDTHHTYDHMQCELMMWSRLAGPETTWLFHDTYMSGPRNEMVLAIEQFAQSNPVWVYDDWRTEPHGLGRMKWRS